MDNKCSKYEGLFVFSDEKTLLEHVENCPDCKAEHEKMQKVSDLLSETKFYYRQKNRVVRKIKAVCLALCLIAFSAGLGVTTNDSDFVDALMYGVELAYLVVFDLVAVVLEIF